MYLLYGFIVIIVLSFFILCNCLKNYTKLLNENYYLKLRIKDLETYKNDISKTIKILNSELTVIHDKLSNETETQTQNQENETGNQENETGNQTGNQNNETQNIIYSEYFYQPLPNQPIQPNIPFPEQFTNQMFNSIIRHLGTL